MNAVDDRSTPPGSPAKRLLSSLIVRLGVAEGLLRRAHHDTVLLYHSVEAQPSGYPYSVSVEAFAQQIAYLARTVEIVPLETLCTTRSERARVALTFDDGYAEIMAGALPTLMRHHVPATIFMATAFAGCTDPIRLEAAFRCAKPVLSWEEMRALRATGLIEIESHTHTHLECVHGLAQMRADVRCSIEIIERETGRRPRYFAYPFGQSNAATTQIAQELGFATAFSTERARLRDRFTEGRFDITRQVEPMIDFRRNLAGFNRDSVREWLGGSQQRRS